MQTQNFPPAMGSQNLCTIVPNQPSGMDQFGFVVNVFNLFQFAGSAIGRPALGFYASLCPNKDSINQLREILSEWKDVLNGLEPEQRAQFENDHPGEFDSMMRGIRTYVPISSACLRNVGLNSLSAGTDTKGVLLSSRLI